MKNKKSVSALSVCVYIIGLWTIIPFVQVDSIYRLIILLCLCVGLMCVIFESHCLLSANQVIAIMIGIILVAFDAIQGGMNQIMADFNHFFLLIMAIISCHIIRNKDTESDQSLLITAVILYTITNIVTCLAIATDETVIRTMVLDVEEAKQLLRQGIGGFGLVFSQTIMVWCGLFALIYLKLPKIQRVLLLCYVVSAVAVILMAQFLLATMALLMGVIVWVIKLQKRNKEFKLLLLLLCVLLILINLEPILVWLVKVTAGTAYQEKLASFLRAVRGDTLKGDADRRIYLYLYSLKCFLRSPLIGTIFNRTSGGHSTILDILSMYGMFVGGALIHTIWLPISNCLKQYKGTDRTVDNLLAVIISVAVICLVFDPMGYHYWFVWFILIPIFIRSFSAARKEVRIEQ